MPEPTGGPQGGPLAVAIRDQSDSTDPVTVAFAPAPLPFEAHLMPVPGFGACAPAGEFRSDPVTGDVKLHWPDDGDAAAQRSVREVLLRLVRADGAGPGGIAARGAALAPALAGATSALPDRRRGPARAAAEAPAGLYDLGNTDPVTWHSLGGATLDAACDNYGRLHGYRGLCVTDAALIPGSTGACNRPGRSPRWWNAAWTRSSRWTSAGVLTSHSGQARNRLANRRTGPPADLAIAVSFEDQILEGEVEGLISPLMRT